MKGQELIDFIVENNLEDAIIKANYDTDYTQGVITSNIDVRESWSDCESNKSIMLDVY